LYETLYPGQILPHDYFATWMSHWFKSIETFLLTFYFQALKMPYCSNKPVPTPGHLLPRPKIPGPAASMKEEETSLKRKIFDSVSDTGDGNMITIWF